MVGVVLGYLAHYGLLLSLGGLLQVSLPQPSLLPALVGVLAGLVLLAGFALPPLLALTRVAPPSFRLEIYPWLKPQCASQ